MNVFKTPATLLTATLLSLGLATTVVSEARAEYETFEIVPGFTPDPLVGTGISGGPDDVGECGFVDTYDSPDHVLYIEGYFEFLRVSVDAPGDVTLLMENVETGESLCIDDSNGTLLPEFAGEWPVGTYFIWVGDFDNGGYPYQLSISEF
ncbi:MAG: hypothetical protein AAGG53_08500 [Cyanobacteria bacterium P01_H01_bin.152]